MDNRMIQQFDKQRFEKRFFLTNIIFYALTSGQLFLLVIFLLINKGTLIQNQIEIDNIFRFLVPLVGLFSMFIARYLYTRKLLRTSQTDSIEEKLDRYKTYKIICWSVLEGAGLFSLVAYFVTANYLYLAVFVFIFGFFLFNKPSKDGFVIDMQITGPIKETILRV